MDLKEFRSILQKSLSKMSFNQNDTIFTDESDLVDIGLDSMSVLLLITDLEEQIGKKLDLDKLEKYDFIISTRNLFLVFFEDQ